MLLTCVSNALICLKHNYSGMSLKCEISYTINAHCKLQLYYHAEYIYGVCMLVYVQALICKSAIYNLYTMRIAN